METLICHLFLMQDSHFAQVPAELKLDERSELLCIHAKQDDVSLASIAEKRDVRTLIEPDSCADELFRAKTTLDVAKVAPKL
jgi:hypothetical protein